MTREYVTVHIDLEIYDAEELATAAVARAIEDGVDPADAAETYTVDDLPACAQMLLDPGTIGHGASILSSSAD